MARVPAGFFESMESKIQDGLSRVSKKWNLPEQEVYTIFFAEENAKSTHGDHAGTTEATSVDIAASSVPPPSTGKKKSSYQAYFCKRRLELVKACPTKTFGELSTFISQEWKAMDSKQKLAVGTAALREEEERKRGAVATPRSKSTTSNDGNPVADPSSLLATPKPGKSKGKASSSSHTGTVLSTTTPLAVHSGSKKNSSSANTFASAPVETRSSTLSLVEEEEEEITIPVPSSLQRPRRSSRLESKSKDFMYTPFYSSSALEGMDRSEFEEDDGEKGDHIVTEGVYLDIDCEDHDRPEEEEDE